MNATALTLPTSHNEIFSPSPTRALHSLIEEHANKRKLLLELSELADQNGYKEILPYFATDTALASVPNLADIFDITRALKSLDADFWDQALELTDIYNLMPQARRDEWNSQIRDKKTPPFEKTTVLSTLETLLAERPLFLAERVDGIFRALSRDHLTNSPWGFGKRMILADVTDKYHFTSSTQCGHINDLRSVIAKLVGRDAPHWNSTRFVISTLQRHTGEWHSLDGGALRLKVYKKGTAHIEIHPDMAWRLNAILAQLYPRAIPTEHRTPSKKASSRRVKVINNLIPFEILALLEDLQNQNLRRAQKSYRLSLPYSWSRADKHLKQRAESILAAIGGIPDHGAYSFEYNPLSVLAELTLSGTFPDPKSYQFYPTPPDLADQVVDLAEIAPHHSVLEPSAGLGNLAKRVPSKNLECIELSSVHAASLRTQGFTVQTGDFLELNFSQKYDRVLMNPPFSEGRWSSHVSRALSLLKADGILVAILPASAKNSPDLKKFYIDWIEPHASFPGISIDTLIMKASPS